MVWNTLVSEKCLDQYSGVLSIKHHRLMTICLMTFDIWIISAVRNSYWLNMNLQALPYPWGHIITIGNRLTFMICCSVLQSHDHNLQSFWPISDLIKHWIWIYNYVTQFMMMVSQHTLLGSPCKATEPCFNSFLEGQEKGVCLTSNTKEHSIGWKQQQRSISS